MADAAEQITIVSLVHDLQNKRSIVTLVWNEPDKRLALPVPFGTSLETVHEEAATAVREFATRMTSIQIKAP